MDYREAKRLAWQLVWGLAEAITLRDGEMHSYTYMPFQKCFTVRMDEMYTKFPTVADYFQEYR